MCSGLPVGRELLAGSRNLQPMLPCLLLAQAQAQPAFSHTHPPLMFTLCGAGWVCQHPWRHAPSSASAWMAASWRPPASLAY